MYPERYEKVIFFDRISANKTIDLQLICGKWKMYKEFWSESLKVITQTET
jgi:hypothetical protein